jgi:hypothetical protein
VVPLEPASMIASRSCRLILTRRPTCIAGSFSRSIHYLNSRVIRIVAGFWRVAGLLKVRGFG